MNSIEIREYTDMDMKAILSLYNSVGWLNYTNNPSMLEAACRNSLKILAAWNDDKLIGIIRAVGDGVSIVYIQDIIVLPEYQRRGVGGRLVNEIDMLFPNVYQKVLLTDNQTNSLGFYQRCGFSLSDNYKCVAFVKFTP